MPHIRTIPDADATGQLRDQYVAAIRRAGKVYNIVRIMSLNAPAMRDSMALYITLMYGRSPLPRWVRELIATVVSRSNACFY